MVSNFRVARKKVLYATLHRLQTHNEAQTYGLGQINFVVLYGFDKEHSNLNDSTMSKNSSLHQKDFQHKKKSF